MSSYYDLYKVNTPYNLPGDTYITGSGTLFQDLNASDASMNGSGGSVSCTQDGTVYTDGRAYHDRWWQIPLTGTPYAGTGLTGAAVTGTTYRLRTATDPHYQAATSTLGSSSDPVNQAIVDAQNSFAIYASSGTSGTPQVYGLAQWKCTHPFPAGRMLGSSWLRSTRTAGRARPWKSCLWDPVIRVQLSATMNVLEPCVSGASCTIKVADPNPGTTDTWSYEYADISSLSAERRGQRRQWILPQLCRQRERERSQGPRVPR